MEKQELLIPRYKVIALLLPPYKRVLNVGDIFIPSPNSPNWFETLNENDFSIVFSIYNIENYTHLFKKIHWSEERKIKDLPKYVKFLTDQESRGGYKTGAIVQVDEWDISKFPLYPIADLIWNYASAIDLLPASEIEYSEYQKAKRDMHYYQVKFMLKGCEAWKYSDILIFNYLPNAALLQFISKVLVRRFGNGI